jgi:hypothetical protein
VHSERDEKNSLERKRERQSVVAPHANFARGREKREKERAVLIMKKSSGSSFQNLQGTNTLRRLVKESGVVVVFFFKEERKHRNCASPSDDNLFYDWGFVFFFVASSSSCAKRCFVPVFSRSRANSANDDDSPF